MKPNEVDEFVDQLIEHSQDEGKYFNLTIVQQNDKRSKESTASLRLADLPADKQVMTFGKSRKIVRCVTDDGRHVDLLIGFGESDTASLLILFKE